jgi:hypothetical protein
MASHTFRIAMVQRGAATIPGNVPDAHRGLWFYPGGEGEVAKGDTVEFVCCGEVVARGVVTGEANPANFPKFCSRVNDRGFTWRDE